jgi:hypothetical protein
VRFLITPLVCRLTAAPAMAGWLDGHVDSEDGKFDISDWLLEQHG